MSRTSLLISIFLVIAFIALLSGVGQGLTGLVRSALLKSIWPAVKEHYEDAEKANAELAAARAHAKIQRLPFWNYFYIIAACMILSTGSVSVLFFAHAWYCQHSVIPQVFGSTTIQVPRKYLRSKDFPRWLAGLTAVEQIRAQNPQEALEMTAQLVRSICGRSGLSRMIDITPQGQEAMALPESASAGVPSFRELYETQAIRPGHMILGYEDGIAREGSFLDIYSAAVAGESGSGKTKTMLFLIGSGIVAYKARFFGIDPHYPHPQGLAIQTKPLWEKGLITMATSKDAMLATLQRIEKAIRIRFEKWNEDMPPMILVIDELLFLSKQKFASHLFRVMEQVSTEGRKAGVYMLASSQAWQAKRLGNDSIVRDTLTSAYVHKIKPKQASLLLQDKDEVAKVRSLSHPGEALLSVVNGDSAICQIPLTEPHDMELIATRYKKTVPLQHKKSEDEQKVDTIEYPYVPTASIAPKISSEFIQKDITSQCETDIQAGRFPSKNQWLAAFADFAGVNAHTLKACVQDCSKVSLDTWQILGEKLIQWRAEN